MHIREVSGEESLSGLCARSDTLIELINVVIGFQVLGLVRHHTRNVVALIQVLEDGVAHTEDTRAQVVWAQNEVGKGWDNNIGHLSDSTWTDCVVL